jgi:hypothetical protein
MSILVAAYRASLIRAGIMISIDILLIGDYSSLYGSNQCNLSGGECRKHRPSAEEQEDVVSRNNKVPLQRSAEALSQVPMLLFLCDLLHFQSVETIIV